MNLTANLLESATIRIYKRRVGDDEWRLAAEGHNIPVTDGLEQTHKLLWGTSTTSFGYLALGSDDTPPAAGDSALGSENSDSRLAFTGKTISGGSTTIKVYFAPAYGNGNIKEWGMFSAAAGGIMFNRGLVEPTITKEDTEELLAEIVVTLEAG